LAARIYVIRAAVAILLVVGVERLDLGFDRGLALGGAVRERVNLSLERAKSREPEGPRDLTETTLARRRRMDESRVLAATGREFVVCAYETGRRA